jgi:hypothetical protein
MKQELERAVDEVRGAWRFRWIGLTDRYEAEARVFVDTRTALKPALQGLTTDQNVDAQINYVRQSLLEGPQLERIAKETGVLDSSVTDERARRSIRPSERPDRAHGVQRRQPGR